MIALVYFSLAVEGIPALLVRLSHTGNRISAIIGANWQEIKIY